MWWNDRQLTQYFHQLRLNKHNPQQRRRPNRKIVRPVEIYYFIWGAGLGVDGIPPVSPVAVVLAIVGCALARSCFGGFVGGADSGRKVLGVRIPKYPGVI